jgi:hypothetical protein
MISAGTLTDLHQDQLPFILYELPCQFSGIIFYSYSLHKRKQQRNEQSILPLLPHHCSLTVTFITLLLRDLSTIG